MPSLFVPADRVELLDRLEKLQRDATRQWGKMSSSQALAHCSAALEAGTGDKPRKQALIGKVFAPLVRKRLLGDRPMPRNSPTDPAFVVTDERDFAAERGRLTSLIDRFCELGPSNAGDQTHSFFGRLTGEEWGRVMYKHIDHHLRQFGA
jgi:Protein of unknown function (DUF1569)